MKKFYARDSCGIVFKTDRRPGFVAIPNYVYDIWMPVIGSDAIGVYGVYCRLEMNGSVKRITLRELATACRIGTDKLRKINEKLEGCGFITVSEPEGHERLMHYTTEIKVHDPPRRVSYTIIEKYAPRYTPLTPWLTETSENLNRFSDKPEQVVHENLNGSPKIEDQYIEDLNNIECTTEGAMERNAEQSEEVLFEDDSSGLFVYREQATNYEIKMAPGVRGFDCPECGKPHSFPSSKQRRRRRDALTCRSCGATFAVRIIADNEDSPLEEYCLPPRVFYRIVHPAIGTWITDEQNGEEFLENWQKNKGATTKLIAWALRNNIPPDKSVARINTALRGSPQPNKLTRHHESTSVEITSDNLPDIHALF